MKSSRTTNCLDNTVDHDGNQQQSHGLERRSDHSRLEESTPVSKPKDHNDEDGQVINETPPSSPGRSHKKKKQHGSHLQRSPNAKQKKRDAKQQPINLLSTGKALLIRADLSSTPNVPAREPRAENSTDLVEQNSSRLRSLLKNLAAENDSKDGSDMPIKPPSKRKDARGELKARKSLGSDENHQPPYPTSYSKKGDLKRGSRLKHRHDPSKTKRTSKPKNNGVTDEPNDKGDALAEDSPGIKLDIAYADDSPAIRIDPKDDESESEFPSEDDSIENIPGAFHEGNSSVVDGEDDDDDIENQIPSNASGNPQEENILVEAELAPDVEALVEEKLRQSQQNHQESSKSEDIVQAKVVKKICCLPRNLFFIMEAIVLVAAIVIGAVLATSDAPIIIQSNETQAPTSLRYREVLKIIQPSLNTTELSFIQYQALDWLAHSDPAMLPTNTKHSVESLLDRFVLALLYYTMGGERWRNQTNWLSELPVCLWSLVDCAEDRVTKLDLYENNLTGTIPSEFGLLQNLTLLDLSSNDELTGAIPVELFQIKTLKTLHIAKANGIVGTIPTEVGQLSNVESLAIMETNVDGTLPTELGLLEKLQELYMSGNILLGGTIPTELFRLSALKNLLLYNCNLVGSLPSEIGRLTDLEYLFLNNNALAGFLPDAIGKLTNMIYFAAGTNKFNGPIPTTIGKMRNLINLDLYENKLWGKLPSEIGRLTQLEKIHLISNILQGHLPTELALLLKLNSFGLADNAFTGSLPTEIGSMKNLTHISLKFNEFTGQIPSEIGHLSQLTQLGLAGNKFVGFVPSELGALSLLQHATFHDNHLTGGLESLFCPTPPAEFSSDCFGSQAEVVCGCCTVCCEDNLCYNTR